MTQITGRGGRPVCDLRQRNAARFRALKLRAAAKYRSHIAELSGFARVRCPSDAY
ncbi:hypothetical protein HTV80_02655 [Streptomyces sp. Vc74B-19]|uniref:hypothetical protein n=1 Tax=unclassified Streptomyces TaxID=2593676 RepID=UPI001BFC7DFC|nr:MULTISPECIES: hypothetical protein [unclassified Streptomyces]MBT3162012.1 hypothetical protein [Streptomyces sp. Vc74B-19]MDU0304755.1 hypothetical protein [Streptomyces sp. PAL114]